MTHTHELIGYHTIDSPEDLDKDALEGKLEEFLQGFLRSGVTGEGGIILHSECIEIKIEEE